MPDTPTLTLAELSARVGVPVRTIRDYQQRGLLPRPEMRGRQGIYSRDHVQRLEVIAALKKMGLSLGSITSLLSRQIDAESAMMSLQVSAERYELDGRELLPLDHAVLTELRALGESAFEQLESIGLVVQRSTGYAASAHVMSLLRELLALEVRSTALSRVIGAIRTISAATDAATSSMDAADSARARALINALTTRTLIPRPEE